MCFRKFILRYFRTHLDQNPVQSTLFRSFWCPTEHIFWIFWNRLQVHNINIFIQISKFSCFWRFNLGGNWRNSTFCEKMKFLSKQYRLRKKKRTKNKKKFLHLTNQVKTEENWDFFLLLIASVRRENKFWFFWKSKLPLKETRFGRKKIQQFSLFSKKL